MNTDTLISELASAGTPVRPNLSPSARTLLWLGFSVLWVLAGALLIGPRSDLAAAIRANYGIAGQALLLLAATGLSAWAAFRLSVPGEKFSPFSLLLAAIPLLVWAGWMGYEAACSPGEPGAGVRCVRNILLFGSGPMLLFFYLLSRGLPLRGGQLGWLAAVGAVALANAGTCFVCHNESAGHILVWHLLPVMALGLTGIPLGRWALRDVYFPANSRG